MAAPHPARSGQGLSLSQRIYLQRLECACDRLESDVLRRLSGPSPVTRAVTAALSARSHGWLHAGAALLPLAADLLSVLFDARRGGPVREPGRAPATAPTCERK